MAITENILATYRDPSKVLIRLLSLGPREDRALAYLMGACILVFIAQWPKLARDAFVNNVDLNFLLGANLMALVVIAPLLLYVIATLARGVGFIFGGQGTAYGARLALFWALLASTPLILLHGLTAGFVGPGAELKVVGVIWLGVFFWFCISGSIAQERYT